MLKYRVYFHLVCHYSFRSHGFSRSVCLCIPAFECVALFRRIRRQITSNRFSFDYFHFALHTVYIENYSHFFDRCWVLFEYGVYFHLIRHYSFRSHGFSSSVCFGIPAFESISVFLWIRWKITSDCFPFHYLHFTLLSVHIKDHSYFHYRWNILLEDRVEIHIFSNHRVRSHCRSGSVCAGVPAFEEISFFCRCCRQVFSDRLTFLYFQFCCGSIFLMYLDRACCCKYRVHGDIIGRYASLSESFSRSVFLCIPAFENISCFRRRCHFFCGDSLSGFHICHFHAGDILAVIFYCITALFSQVQIVPHRLFFADQSCRTVFCIDLCQIRIQRTSRYSYRRNCSLGNSGKCS